MKKLFFFAVLIVVLYNIIGCTKNEASQGPITDTFTIIHSIYRVDDATTGIFNYTGIVNDSVQVIDSVSPPSASGYPYYYASYKVFSHQVSGQIRIKKLVSDSTVIHLTRPINDGFDSVSKYSGMIFQTDTSYFVNFFSGPSPSDTVIRASYLNNILNISDYANSPLDINWNFIKLFNGNGRFVNGKWEINYQTSGTFTERIASLPPPNNPMPFHERFSGKHTYHLICTK